MWDKIKQKLNEQKTNDFKRWYSEKSFVLYGNLPNNVREQIKKVYPNVVFFKAGETLYQPIDVLIVLSQTTRHQWKKLIQYLGIKKSIEIDGINAYVICKNINKVIKNL